MKRIATAGAIVLAFSLGVPLAGASSAPPASSAPSGRTVSQSNPVKEIHRATLGEVDKVITDAPGLRTEAGTGAGYTFVPINPFRAIDSRGYTEPLHPGEVWWFDVLTDEQGVAQIPAGAVAVTYNLTVTDVQGAGFIGIYPANINWPGTSSINFPNASPDLANGGTVAVGFLDAPGQVEVYLGPAPRPGLIDFIVDITGYYI